MRVLVTRPEAKAARTCARLEAMGHQAFQLPLFRPVHAEGAARRSIGPGYWSALAVTSTEALHDVVADRDATSMKDRPVFAVGKKTAEAARKAGFTRVIEGSGNGERLAETIAASDFDRAAPLLYLAGCPRAPFFEQALERLKVDFETVTVYVMQPAINVPAQAETLLKKAKPDAVLFYSTAGASRFFDLVRCELMAEFGLHPQFLCLSAAVAAAIPEAMSSAVRIAETPDETSLLALLN
ncbi:uroporphyrinogen-III synthase [uncultured Martelella sp.]|uniref:uroporphyrinogen-III synthase n=1 Tax=uncultured Martelella sp. TaxID=392331 RepID=UPI0029C94645|nr:uroporphyrinogen-III synthase [uncultured Martelella sp.]